MTGKLYIDSRVEIARRALLNKELTITWETDPKKMDFSKLRGFPDELVDPGAYRIEYHPVQTLNKTKYADLVGQMEQEMLDLIDFIKTGAKIIPPSFVQIPEIIIGMRIVNNQLMVATTKKGLQVHDGCHRVCLAKALGLSEIPVLVFDWDDSYRGSLVRYVCIEGYNVSEI